MESCESKQSTTVTNEDQTLSCRVSSPLKEDSKLNHSKDDTEKGSKQRGRRHSSTFSALVGNIGTRIKRSSSTVNSSSDGCISGSKSIPPGSMSTPSQRKNSSSTSETLTENVLTKPPSRRSSTPTNQRNVAPIITPKGKKTSLRGIFSSSRKSSLQSEQNGADKLPPRPPLLIKESNQDIQCEILDQINFDHLIRNGTNGSTPNIHSRPAPPSSASRNVFSSNDGNQFSDRRTRMHKHSLQHGNKWKLLQQKILGNVDEEIDDEQEFPENQSHGKNTINMFDTNRVFEKNK